MIKIFISYSIKDKVIAGDLKKHFETYGVIECFVAHDDIDAGTEWEQEILRNLETSDYFMPLMTKNLETSYWCQQEAGFAFAKGIKIIPLIPDVDATKPVGFFAKYQGQKIRLDNLEQSTQEWLEKEGIIEKSDSEVEKVITIFATSDSFAEASRNTRLLLELNNKFTKKDIVQIARISCENNQILDSWGARELLRPFFVKNAKIIPDKLFNDFLKGG